MSGCHCSFLVTWYGIKCSRIISIKKKVCASADLNPQINLNQHRVIKKHLCKKNPSSQQGLGNLSWHYLHVTQVKPRWFWSRLQTICSSYRYQSKLSRVQQDSDYISYGIVLKVPITLPIAKSNYPFFIFLFLILYLF